MRIFDLHADVGYDIYHNQDTNRLNERLECMKKGEISYFCLASYFDGNQTFEDMQAMILNANIKLSENKLKIIRNKEDLKQNELISCIMSVEGMCGIHQDVEKQIEWLYEHGIRLASLTWNEHNHLANGSLSKSYNGLSTKGKLAIKTMNKLNMIIDVSHTNEASFWDIIKLSKKPVIASHSNARSIMNHDRNLTDQMIGAIINTNGLIGLNAYYKFIGGNNNAKSLARHALHIKELGGINNIALGFDYMDYFEGYSRNNDLHMASDSQTLIKALEDVGFNDLEIEKIAYLNALLFFEKNLI